MFVIVGEIRQAMLFDIGSVMEPAVYVHGRYQFSVINYQLSGIRYQL